ncbi:YycC family protein [Cohnella soli]|uniref:YycC family protein n=1 Tax=Cohnella soli TaxID=425005 RepID=A0ABW0HRS6_9BACL
MRKMPISADTAVKLAAYMKVPLEHLMHMPQHMLLQKLAEMAKSQVDGAEKDSHNSGEKS